MASEGTDLLWQGSSAPQNGVVGDANTMLISPDYLGFGQDVIIDTSGVLKNRGGFKTVTTDVFTNITIMGAGQTSNGTVLIGYDAAGNTFWYGTSSTALTGFAKLTSGGYNAVTAESLTIAGFYGSWTGAKIRDERGIAFCFQQYASGATWPSGTLLWGGNATITSNTSTGTITTVVGSRAVVGVGTAWTSALVNTFLFAGTAYVGQVQEVLTTTTLNLYKGGFTASAGATPSFKAGRTMQALVYKGRITTQTTSAVVVGSNTKFASSGPGGSGSTHLTATPGKVFRYSDGALIGTVTSVQNDTTLTLAGNAAIALVNEEYFILAGNVVSTTVIDLKSSFFGSCVEAWADRYWYGGINAIDAGRTQPGNVFGPYVLNAGNSIAFTKKNDPECFDLDPAAGDILTLPAGINNDQIRGLCATKGGLVVYRNNDTFLITGYSPETFRAIKILDDGCVNTACIKPYKEGVLWAGAKSVWYFDGTRTVNLLQDKLSKFYARSKTVTISSPVALAVANNNVLVSWFTPSLTWPYKNTTKTLQCATLNINLLNGACSFFTNIAVTTGFDSIGGWTTGNTKPVVVVRDKQVPSATTTSYLMDGDRIYQDQPAAANNFDSITGMATFTSGAQIGPDVMFETTKLTMGDATRLKFWKRFLIYYTSAVAMTATFINPTNYTYDFPDVSTGTASTDSIAVSSDTGILHRMRFLIRAPVLAIRVYQTATTTATSQRFMCFWWAVGGKKMRRGRVEP